MRTGTCKFGASCKYHHPRQGGGSVAPVSLNFYGFPLRQVFVFPYFMCILSISFLIRNVIPWGCVMKLAISFGVKQGEKECSYYVKTGQCKFGRSCKFHHPQPAGIQLPVQSPAAQVPPVPAPIPPPALYPPMQSPSGSSSQQYGVVVARPPLVQGSYVQGPYGTMLISPGMVPFPSWSGPYMVSKTSFLDSSVGVTCVLIKCSTMSCRHH